MIVGVGTDLLEIARMRAILEGSAGERFLERVLTSGERELAARRKGRLAEFAAGRFAAKEAVVKALGCGIGRLMSWQDVEVLPDALGKPVCRVAEEAWSRLLQAGTLPDEPGRERIIHLSITHSDSSAMAYAIVELRERERT